MSSIHNDIRARVSRSKLGGVWMILHPLMQVLMYALVLSAVLSTKLPGIDNRFAYAIYLTAGMLAWSLFSEVITRCLTIFIENGNLMKKMAFPKICLPLIVSGSALLNSLLLFSAIVLIFMILGHLPQWPVLWLPILLIITLAFGLGIGLILGVLNVFIRDVGQIIPVLLQFGFWFTPIVYPSTIIPVEYRGWMEINPMYHIVSAYQDILVYHQSPEWMNISIVTMISLILLVISLLLFRKANAEMVDAL